MLLSTRTVAARTVLTRTAVPVAVAGLLLTGCSGDKPHTSLGAPQIAPRNEPNIAPTVIGGSGVALDALPSGMAAGIAAPVSAVSPLAAAPAATVDGHTLSTRGVGRATGTPDTLTVLIGVSTQATSARSALDANNSKANALLELLRRNGVANKDLRTSQLSINPTYNDKSTAITGYQVDNTVQATLHDLGKAGALLDAAVGSVGNAVRIQQISFSIGDDTALRAQARAQAVAQARAQASQLAQAAGVSLGSIRSLTELVDAGSPIAYDMGKMAAGASAASVPVQPGQQEITVAVDLVYDIS
ncbi:SIMPL domain-containing protein [Jatrophihabitans sp.]|uniref:SIMPL domain-containing protein n=1 Tax=Jatrophihabitans sp. TaxID=1932789 RepID=UPI002C2D2A73|nr:SIMPL domain-containing protein [Jatrophihabitans sp.]